MLKLLKGNYHFLFLFLIFFITTISLKAQVNYSLKTGFAEKFPFDENFSINFTDLGSDVKLIEVKIWNTTKAHKIQRKLYRQQKLIKKCKKWSESGVLNSNSNKEYKCSQSKEVITISNEELLSDLLIPPPIIGRTSTITKDSNQNHTARINFASKLFPNESYFVEIEAGSLDTLNYRQKAELKKDLLSSKEIKNLIKNLVVHYIPENSLDFSFISENFRSDLIEKTKIVLERLNSNYRILDLNPLELDRRVKNIRLDVQLGYIKTRILEFEQHLDNNTKKEIGYEALKQTYIPNIDSNNSTKFLELFEKSLEEVDKKDIYSDDKEFYEGVVADIIREKEALAEILIEQIILKYTKYFTGINQTYLADAIENSKKYIFADVGYGYANGITHFSSMAASIHLRPINESIPYKHYTGIDILLTRLSIIAGANITGNILTPTRKGIISDNQGILLGIGLRVVPGVKLNSGWMFYYDLLSPLVTQNNPSNSGFVSLAINFNVTPSFKKAFEKK